MKIGIATEDPLAEQTLRRAIALRPSHELLWVASGCGAAARCARNQPELVIVTLPVGTSAADLTRDIVGGRCATVLLVTESIERDAASIFAATGHGSFDSVDSAECDLRDAQSAVVLLAKLDTMARLLGERPAARGDRRRVSTAGCETPLLLAIGASTGGPAAVALVLKQLPADYPAAIVIVQHVDHRFVPSMTDWLRQQSGQPVTVARQGERLAAGRAVMAGASAHLILTRSGSLGYSAEPRDHAYRPSVDVFFESVSEVWSGSAIGVLLTGMGRDGARGLKALRDRGHYTIAQDAASSAVYGMPKAAAALNAAVDILPLDRIASKLTAMLPYATPPLAL